MADIVERLRKYDELGPLSCLSIHPETPGYTTGTLLTDAHDAREEIEKLRAALQEIVDAVPPGYGGTIGAIRKRALSALSSRQEGGGA